MVEGAHLMLLGMSTVFGFLALLVLLMNGAARFFAAYGHLFPEEPSPARTEQDSGALEDGAELAVVLAVAEAWRRKQGR